MIFADLLHRARALFLRSKLDRDLDEELQTHVELEAQKYILAGVPQDEALRRAYLALGSRVQAVEACRDARGVNLFENVWRDCRFTFRAFRRSPAFALTVILIVATAIGANTTVFSFCHAILLSALPIPNPDQLYLPTIHFPGAPEIRYFSYPDLRHMQDACKPAEITGFTDVTQVHVLDSDGTTSTIKG